MIKYCYSSINNRIICNCSWLYIITSWFTPACIWFFYVSITIITICAIHYSIKLRLIILIFIISSLCYGANTISKWMGSSIIWITSKLSFIRVWICNKITVVSFFTSKKFINARYYWWWYSRKQSNKCIFKSSSFYLSRNIIIKFSLSRYCSR